MARKKTGFTLIELLVVIAIIAVLAAILFPVLTAAKERSKLASCTNNMRQLAAAIHSYADDNYGWLPGLNCYMMDKDTGAPIAPDYKSSSFDVTRIRPGTLMKYVRNWEVICCPSDPTHMYSEQRAAEKNIAKLRWNYTINGYMTRADDRGANDRAGADIRGMPLNYAVRASKTILLIDENSDFNEKRFEQRINDALFIWEDRTCDRHSSAKQITYMVNGRDVTGRGIASVAYVDGHVGTVPGGLRWDENLDLFREGFGDRKRNP